MTTIAPVIISASRATDIPAFYSEWLMNRLRAGYAVWTNPFNRNSSQKVSFEKTRAFVFWTKNPAPLMPHLDEIERMGYHYYFQYTLNDYEREGLEPGLPPLDERVETFRALAERVGKERVIWRFDPLLLSDDLTVEGLLARVKGVGDRIHASTERLVFSFADIDAYRTVKRRLGGSYREFRPEEMRAFAEGLAALNRDWGLALATCAEEVDLSAYGVTKNRCIDDLLLRRLFPDDPALTAFLGPPPQRDLFGRTVPAKGLKDKGQRESCGCIRSKDIGAYSTCPHLCLYCYANSAEGAVRRNYERHRVDGEGLIPTGEGA
jgi:DNA repair photolyase